jgi:DNA-binding transcriptional MerR regulator
MPTLQRYKKNYQDRIPSEGEGRMQRYPEEALDVFEEIKKENISKRGRPRKEGSGDSGSKRKGRKTRSRRKGRRGAVQKKAEPVREEKSEDLLTLTEISKRTGISYPTLSRYVKQYGSRLKSKGKGRSRRYYPESVEVFEEIRSQSRRGRGRKKSTGSTKPSSAGRATSSSSNNKTDRDLAKRLTAIERQLKAIEKKLDKPVQLTLRRS